MPVFNPNNPQIAGLEWYPTRQLPRLLKVGAGTGVEIASTVSESITQIAPFLGSPAAAMVGVDIYDETSVVDTVIGGIDVPSEAVEASVGFDRTTDSGGTWATYTSGGVAYVNEVIPDSFLPTLGFVLGINGKWIRYKPAASQTAAHASWRGSGSYHKIEDGTSGGSPAGRRVGWVEVNICARAESGGSGTLEGTLEIAGVRHFSDGGPQRVTGAWRRYTYRFMWNPATGKQWNSSDIVEFVSGGANTFGFWVTGKAPIEWWIGPVNMVFRSVPEHRVATGYVIAPISDFAPITLLNPADGTTAAWAKTSGHKYLAEFFVTGPGGLAALSGVDQQSLAENPNGQLGGWLGADLPTYPSVAVPAGAAALSTWAPSVLLLKSGSVESVDSQPYVFPKAMRVKSTDAPGDNQEQVAAHSTDDYGMVRFVVGLFDEADALSVPTAPLVVQIVNSGGSPVGGTIQLSPEEVPADNRWHFISRRLDVSASLSSGSDYFVTFATTGTPWSVLYLDVVDALAVGAAIEQGGFVGGVSTTFDVVANVGTVPPPIAGFAVEVESFDQEPVPAGGPATISFAELTWTPSSLGDQFGYYEIQRDGETIVLIEVEGTGSFSDTGVRRNAVDNYLIRVVRADGATSDWSDAVDILVPTAAGCDFILSTTDFALGYQEVGDNDPTHTFQRANQDGTIVHKIAGRQAPVAFRPLVEGNSDIFTRTILVNMDVPGVPVTEDIGLDRQAFGQLLNLIENTSSTDPYITVCDGHGYRWYAFVEFVQGSYSWHGHEHQADIKITEVAITAIPAVITET